MQSLDWIVSEIDSLKLRLSKPQRRHLINYVHGLITAEKRKKNIQCINSKFLDSVDQSNLNRFLTKANWNMKELEMKRIQYFIKNKVGGILVIDDTNNEKTGTHIEGIGELYDYTTKQRILCHSIVTSLYLNKDEEVPLLFHPYFKEEVAEKLKKPFYTKIELAKQIIEASTSILSPSFIVFDAWYFAKSIIRLCEEKGLYYVTQAKSNRKIYIESKEISLKEFAKQIPNQAFLKINETLDEQRFRYIYESIVQMKNIGRVKVVFLREKLDGETTFLVTNALNLPALEILKVYKARWCIEVMHRDCKQHLGLGDYQMRSMNGIARHLSLVFLSYSLLKKATYNPQQFNRIVKTIGEACNAIRHLLLEQFSIWLIKLYEKLKNIDKVIMIMRRKCSN